MVECLPSKREALSSNHQTKQNKNRKEKNQINSFSARHQWLTPVTFVTQETEIRRMKLAWANSSQNPILKIPNTRKG
jgi:hypothetical protein